MKPRLGEDVEEIGLVGAHRVLAGLAAARTRRRRWCNRSGERFNSKERTMAMQMHRHRRRRYRRRLLAIGLMSGTSQDGVDVALIETDGEIITRFGPTACRPYSQRRARALAQRHGGGDEHDRPRRAAGHRRRGRGAGERRACRSGRDVPCRQRHRSRAT